MGTGMIRFQHQVPHLLYQPLSLKLAFDELQVLTPICNNDISNIHIMVVVAVVILLIRNRGDAFLVKTTSKSFGRS